MSAAAVGNRAALGHDTLGVLVRLAFLVRLIALCFAVVAMLVSRETTVPALLLLGGLVLGSHLGLQRPSIRAAVVRHPALALPDVVLVCVVPVLTGVGSPLALVGVSSALLIGVLFTPRTSLPLTAALVSCYAVAGLEGAETSVTASATFTLPVVLLSVAATGVAFRHLAEQQQRAEADSASARASAAAAHERLRLARDLHDTVAKSVQGVALTASAIPGWLEKDPARAEVHVRAVVAGAHEAVQAARHLLTSLRLDDPERPLEEVLDELAARTETDRPLHVERDLEPVEPLDPVVRHELVCAISEALENASRHAPGSTVVLRLRDRPDGVEAVVVDDGPGFPADRRRAALDEGRYGLAGISERMAAAGGDAEVLSSPGSGTQVRLRVPYPDVQIDLRLDRAMR